MEFKDRFKDAVAAAGKTMAQLSRETGISESMLSYYANGRTTPRKGKLMVICNNLHVSPGWLLFGEEAIDIVNQDYLVDTYNKLNAESQRLLINYAKFLEMMQGEENAAQK